MCRSCLHERGRERTPADREHHREPSAIQTLIRSAITVPIRLYQIIISPLFPASCIYSPSCSSYALEAIQRHGVVRGAALAVARVSRCSALFSGGLDPVPDRADWTQIRSDYRGFRSRRERRTRRRRRRDTS